MNVIVKRIRYHVEWLYPYCKEQETLVCLHGFTGTGETFRPVFQENCGYNILTIDLIGHGQTSVFVHPYRYQMSSLLEDIKDVTEQLELNRFSLLGYSMGARVALGFAVCYPECLKHLFLESGSPGLKEIEDRKQRQVSDERLAHFIMSQGIEAFVARWEKVPLFETQKKLAVSQRESIRGERLSQQPLGLALSLWYMGTGVQPSLWKNVRELSLSCYIIVGGLDTKFCAIAKEMVSQNQRLTKVVIPNVGHCVHIEAPVKVEKIVRDVMKEGHLSEYYTY